MAAHDDRHAQQVGGAVHEWHGEALPHEGGRGEEDPLALRDQLPGRAGPETAELTWSQPDPEHLIVEGSFRNATIHVRFKKIDESKFLLVSRGFNWIQEYPFNR